MASYGKTYPRISIEYAFWSKVVRAEENECLEWVGAKTHGYGILNRSGRSKRAHRVAYELLVGKIPDGLVLDHLCRNTGCVNPDHLEPVTQQVNCLRGNARFNGRHIRERTVCPRNHPYDTFNHKGERACKRCIRIRNRRAYLKSKETIYV